MITKEDALNAISDLNDIIPRLRHRESYDASRYGIKTLTESELNTQEMNAHAHISMIAEYLEESNSAITPPNN
jgi:hypothetical protein|tara:strand:- start:479 stop:697 length:219 start_codon:yes stop_codon:yes gene_type:complete